MKNKLVILLSLIGNLIFAQCPNTQLYDLDLTVASTNPVWKNRIDNEGIPDAYTLDLISPNDILNYTIDWGDGSGIESGASWLAGTTVSHNYTDLGKYTVVLKETQNACTRTVTGTLISDRKPGATATPPTLNTSGCVPHALTFINKTNNISKFTNFIWNWGDGTTTVIPGNSTAPGSVNVPISHVFQKGSSRCGMSVKLTAMSLSDTTFVIYGPYDFYDIDTAKVGASNVQICVGDTVTFNDLTGYNCIPGTRRIQWDLSDFGGGITPWLPATPQNKQKKYYLDGPVGTVFTIALRDSNTCGVDSRSIQVTVIAPPVSVPIVVDDSICQGETGQFRNQSTGGSSYIWLWGDGKQTSTTSKNIQNHVYNTSGTFNVALIASYPSSKKCVDTAYTKIEVSPAPNVSFSTSVSEGCDQVSTTFTNTSSSVLKSFQWTFDNGTTNTVDNSVLVSYPTKGYFVPTLVGTNAFNCQTIVDDTILVLPKPKVIFSDDSLCFGELYKTNNQSSIESFPGGSLIHEVFDNINGSSIASLTGSAKFKSGLADRKFKLTTFSTAQNIGDNFGSRIRGFIKPTVTGNYKFFIASDDNSQLFLSTSLNESDKVQIASVPDFTNFGQWNKYPSQQSDFIRLEAGKYYYIEALHKEGSGGDFVQVGWQLPNGQLQQPIPGAVLTPYFDGLVIDKFDWNFGDGSAIVTAKDTSHSYSLAGNYKVKLTASTKTCSSSDSITVKVAEKIIDSLVFLDTAACTPFEIQVIDSTNANRLIYVFGDGQRDTINHVLGDTFSYTYFNNTNQSRFYNFTATLKGQFNCKKEIVQAIEIYPGPPGTIEIDAPFPPCAPFELKAGNSQFKNNLTYTWLLNGSSIDTDSSIVTPIVNNSPSLRNDVLSLLVESAEGCSKLVTQKFNVYPEPDYQLIQSIDSGCSELKVQFSIDKFAQSYLWSFGDGNFSTAPSPINNYKLTTKDDSTFTVKVDLLSPFSCPDTLFSTVYVQKNIKANFIASPQTQTYPDTTINLINLSSGPIDDFQWIFASDTIKKDTSIYGFNSVGTKIIQLVATNEFCRSVAKDTIVILPPVPTAQFIGGGVGCINSKFEFTNQSKFANSYIWYFGDGKTSTLENPTHTYTKVGKFNVSLKVQGIGGTDSTITFGAVEIIPKPVSKFTVTTDTLYLPDSTFSYVSQSTGTIQNTKWISGDGDTSLNVNAVSFNYGKTGNYKPKLIVSNTIQSCVDTSSIDVWLLPELPRASFTGSGIGCAPLSVKFKNTSTKAQFLRWDFGDGSVSFEQNPTHIYTSVGNFSVKLYVANLIGEDSTTVSNAAQVTARPVAKFSIANDSLNFPDTTFTLVNTSTGNFTEVLWKSGDGDVSTDLSSVDFSYQTIKQYNPKLIVKSAIPNCIDSVSVPLWLLPAKPIASFNGSDTACAPLRISFENTSENAQFVKWDFGDGKTSSELNPIHVYNTVGKYTVKLLVTNSQGKDSVTVLNAVEVLAMPVAKFSIENDSLNFPDTTFTLVNTSTGNFNNVIWYSGDGDKSNSENGINFSYQLIKQYTPKLVIASDIPNCKDSTTLPLWLLSPLPIASFVGSDTACAPLTVSFENTSKNAEFIRWDFGDGKTSNEINPFHTYNKVGTYTVKLFVSNDQGEDSVRVFNAIKVLEKPTAQFAVNKDSLIYPDTTFVFENKSSKDVTSNIWTIESRDTSINSSSFQYGFKRLGQQIVSLNVATGFDKCIANFKDTVFIKPPFPVAEFSGTSSGCLPVTATFKNLSKYADSYFWEFGDGSFSRSPNPSHTYSQPGVFDVTLTVTNATGSDAIAKSGVVQVYDYPSALFTTNPAGGQEIVVPVNVFFNNKSSNAKTYVWDFGDGSSSTSEKPLHRYTTPGTYPVNLIAVNEFGCADTFELAPPLVLIDGGKLVVPNAFSPNIDGPSARGDIEEGLYNNDIFFPKIKGNIEVYKMYIFNRWGELLFVSEDQNIGWDGYYLGELCKQDVYVYKIEVTFKEGKTEIITGDFALIR